MGKNRESFDFVYGTPAGSLVKIIDDDACPVCGCKKIKITAWHNGDFIEEQLEECLNCGAIKYHNAYGSVYFDEWKRYGEVPLIDEQIDKRGLEDLLG